MKLRAEKNSRLFLNICFLCVANGHSNFHGFLFRQFKIMDDDRSRTLSLDEFCTGIHDFGLNVSLDVSSIFPLEATF